MPKLNEKGVIAPLLILLLLIAGLVAGVYLIQNRTNLLPRASVSSPLTPQTSLTFSPSVYQINVGQEVAVKILARSDISAANLFTAKVNFDPALLQLGRVDTTSPFIKNWVEQSWSDPGKISLIGGVPNPGFKTQVGDIAPMATLYFTALKTGTATISFDDASAIYSNADNLNILAFKDPVNIAIVSGGASPTPTTTAGSRVFVTSTTYNGNLGGLVGADAKCQARADAANLGGTWKAWLSDATGSPSTRFIKDTASYKNVIGGVIANNWQDLTDQVLTNSMTVNENGAFQNITEPFNVWTNVWTTGYGYEIDTNLTCNNWTSSSSSINGIGGASWKNDSNWTLVGTQSTPVTATCDSLKRLYCFEQIGQPVSTPTPTPAPTPVATPVPGTGDGNKDGKVDLIDLSVLLSDFNKNQGIRTDIDMNGDGIINVFDFGLMRNLLIQKGVIKG